MTGKNEESYVIYVDTGGTFSDAIVVSADGSIVTGKADTTHERLEECFFSCIQNACQRKGISLTEALSKTRALGYGTTMGTNIVVTTIGGLKLGFITTKGEEDRILIIRRRAAGLTRAQGMHMIAAPDPVQLVPRTLIKGVPELVDCTGKTIIPLHEGAVRQAVKELLDEKVDGIAVGLLWSFLNPTHERQVEAIIQEMSPGLPVSLSSVVCPIVREYPRFMTAIIDLYIGKALRELLQRIEESLKEYGYRHPLLVETAVGGVSHSSTVKPANTLHSGPVGGLAGVDFIRENYGYRIAIGTDVGGTSFDVSVSKEGAEAFVREPVVGRYEVANPMREVITIGAGGGSIAWVEPVTNTLRVGPNSAGSTPGPVCYGRGGTEPTVTDADVVMNRIDPNYFLGGAKKLDAEASRRAIKEKIADPLNMSVEDTAEAICKIVDGSMGVLVRTVVARHGVDPKVSLLLAFGGAGPTHCAGYSEGLGFTKVLIPSYAACFSAFGASTCNIKHRYETSPFIIIHDLPYDVTTRRFEVEKLNSMEQIPSWVTERFNIMFEELERRAYADLESEGFDREQATLLGEMLARYSGQLSEISAVCPVRQMDSVEDVRALISSFENKYEEIYGPEAFAPAGGLEILGITLTTSAPVIKPKMAKYEYGGEDPKAAFKGEREVYFGRKWVKSKIYEMEKLEPGNVVEGPSIIEAKDSTVVIPPDRKVTVDEYRYMMMEEKKE
jgi:N-methylhydantoinase A/oxoprolinase/acetone carboxylase beta subunit